MDLVVTLNYASEDTKDQDAILASREEKPHVAQRQRRSPSSATALTSEQETKQKQLMKRPKNKVKTTTKKDRHTMGRDHQLSP